MSKIIYRKVHTAPGLKTTDANWDQSAAYYVKAVSTETLSLRDMAKHISSHGSPFTADTVMGVLEAFRSCLLEQLLESKKVKIEGLGTFYVTIANKRGGEKDLSKFNIGSMAVGLRIRFLPETATEEKISQKEFLKKAKFIDVADLANLDETPSDEDSNGVVVDDPSTGGSGQSNGGGTSNGGSGSQQATVAAPTFSGATQFTETTQVTMSGPAGASIFYTVDGSTPTDQSLEYEEPITLSATTTVKAIAIKDGISSAVTSRTYSKVEGGGDDEPGGDDH